MFFFFAVATFSLLAKKTCGPSPFSKLDGGGRGAFANRHHIFSISIRVRVFFCEGLFCTFYRGLPALPTYCEASRNLRRRCIWYSDVSLFNGHLKSIFLLFLSPWLLPAAVMVMPGLQCVEKPGPKLPTWLFLLLLLLQNVRYKE